MVRTTPQSRFEPADYARLVPKLFEHARSELGAEVELLHDVHTNGSRHRWRSAWLAI